jgi:hypothetical protein
MLSLVAKLVALAVAKVSSSIYDSILTLPESILFAVISKPPTVPFVLFWYCAERSSWLISKYEFGVISSYKGVDETLIVVSVEP